MNRKITLEEKDLQRILYAVLHGNSEAVTAAIEMAELVKTKREEKEAEENEEIRKDYFELVKFLHKEGIERLDKEKDSQLWDMVYKRFEP